MSAYIGIDLGTSSVKLILADEEGKILASHSESYAVFYPQSGWSEQQPEDWFNAVDRGIRALLQGKNGGEVRGISFGGQMHGLVALDKDDRVIRPCILWNDGRAQAQADYLNTVVGRSKLTEYTANVAFAGFTAPKIAWLKENEPENYGRIAKIMLPKDYLLYRFTGVHATDFSDASGTLLLDVKNKRWSGDMCRLTGVEEGWLPRLYESFQPVGTLNSNLAARWGLGKGVIVAAGAGDNAAAAIGTGTVRDGSCNISLGTSGTVFIAGDNFSVDENNALHSFAHANGKFHLMGCILSACSCNDWWHKILGSSDFIGEQAEAEKFVGDNETFFLPYLMGERSPHNDAQARAAFIGMRADTPRSKLGLAVLEGVAFALKDCVERSGTVVKSACLCGGGAKSALWRKIVASVLNANINLPAAEEGPAYGAAMLAMTACGVYKTVQDAADNIVKIRETVEPDSRLVEKYAEKYDIFAQIYPALKPVFQKIR